MTRLAKLKAALDAADAAYSVAAAGDDKASAFDAYNDAWNDAYDEYVAGLKKQENNND